MMLGDEIDLRCVDSLVLIRLVTLGGYVRCRSVAVDESEATARRGSSSVTFSKV